VAAAASDGGNGQTDTMLLRLLGLTNTPNSNSSSSSSSRSDRRQALPSLAAAAASSNRSDSSSGFDGGSGSGIGSLRQGIINPHNPLYMAWRGLLIGAAAFTGIFIPWELAFGDFQHMYCLDNVATWVDVLLVCLFVADIGEAVQRGTMNCNSRGRCRSPEMAIMQSTQLPALQKRTPLAQMEHNCSKATASLLPSVSCKQLLLGCRCLHCTHVKRVVVYDT
jgi:hypothetical protein